jgi:hypothetical protein
LSNKIKKRPRAGPLFYVKNLLKVVAETDQYV